MSTEPKRDINLVSLLWAGPETAAEIAGMHAALFDPVWDEASLASMLEHPGSTALIAKTGFPKVNVGFVIGQIAADQAEIMSVGVVKDWQRIGLGKKLIDSMVRSLAKAQAKQLFLEVAEDNASAFALYVKCGFKEVARRKGYYPRPGAAAVDAIVLSRPA